MPGPRAEKNLQMPLPGTDKAGKCPAVARGGGGLDAGGIDWRIIYKSRLLSFSFASRSRDIRCDKHTFFCYNLHLLLGMKPVTLSSLRYIWWLCDSQDMMLERTLKSVTLGMPISCPACRACQTQLALRSACPACQTRRSKTGNELSTRREIWNLSLARSILGCEGMNPFFPCLWDVISKYQCSLEFCHA